MTALLSSGVIASVPMMETSQPLIGAIRWDAWYDPSDGTVAKAVEAALGPAKYHLRMPFFGRETGPNSVRIDGYSQSVLDQEIYDAAYAGLDYWAFDTYAPDSPMSNALRLYLSSSGKGKIKFCMLTDIGSLADRSLVDWHHHLMSDASYQRVLTDRPLYYVLIPDGNAIDRIGGRDRAHAAIASARKLTISRRAGNPYFVMLNQSPTVAADLTRAMGGDAIGCYAVNSNRHHASSSELVGEAEELWDEFAATGAPVVPPVITGFDRRPRVEHPVPWERQSTPPSATSEIYYRTTTPDEIGRELRDCIQWMKSHPAAVPANTALIYAWNEFDEGGWLCPTYPNDRSRIEAVRRVLRGAE